MALSRLISFTLPNDGETRDNWKLSVLDISADEAAERLKEDGYILLDISRALQDGLTELFEAARLFFGEAVEAKKKNSFPKDMGYRPYGREYSLSPLIPDQVESFSVGAEMVAAEEMRSKSAKLLCERMLISYHIIETIAEELTIKLANRLSQRAIGDQLRGELHRWSRLQLNYSRPSEVDAAFINESHEDGALLTISHAREPGLELKLSDDEEFVPITNTPSNVLVMPGDIAWLLSGGFLRPMFHRVRPSRNCSERMALLFFADINPHLCEPWVKNTVNQDVDIPALVLKNPKRFGLEEWDIG